MWDDFDYDADVLDDERRLSLAERLIAEVLASHRDDLQGAWELSVAKEKVRRVRSRLPRKAQVAA